VILLGEGSQESDAAPWVAASVNYSYAIPIISFVLCIAHTTHPPYRVLPCCTGRTFTRISAETSILALLTSRCTMGGARQCR